MYGLFVELTHLLESLVLSLCVCFSLSEESSSSFGVRLCKTSVTSLVLGESIGVKVSLSGSLELVGSLVGYEHGLKYWRTHWTYFHDKREVLSCPALYTSMNRRVAIAVEWDAHNIDHSTIPDDVLKNEFYISLANGAEPQECVGGKIELYETKKKFKTYKITDFKDKIEIKI